MGAKLLVVNVLNHKKNQMIYPIKNTLCFSLLITLSLFKLPDKHIYPESVANEVEIALSHYPELAEVAIEFKFKNKIRKSTMQAQPEFWSFFGSKKKRRYK